jgi:hypothetical protein
VSFVKGTLADEQRVIAAEDSGYNTYRYPMRPTY